LVDDLLAVIRCQKRGYCERSQKAGLGCETALASDKGHDRKVDKEEADNVKHFKL
jgi:hypothetical protein